MSSGQQDEDSQGGFNTEDGHRESQAARNTLVLLSSFASSVKPSNGNNEFLSLSFPVNGSHGPCDTNTQEHIDSIGASHVSNRVVSSVVLNSGGLGSKSV